MQDDESAMKDETIKKLQHEIKEANTRIAEYCRQVNEAEVEIENCKVENKMLDEEIISDKKMLRKDMDKLEEVMKQYTASIEKTSQLENEIKNEEAKFHYLQGTLTTALFEIFLGATPPAEDADANADSDVDVKILSEFYKLRREYDAQRQRLVKAKAVQIQACKTFKKMIDLREKTNDEIAELQRQVEHLRNELKPQRVKFATPSSSKEERILSRNDIRESVFRNFVNLTIVASIFEKKEAVLDGTTEDGNQVPADSSVTELLDNIEVSDNTDESRRFNISTSSSSPDLVQLPSKLNNSDDGSSQAQKALKKIKYFDIVGQHFANKLRAVPTADGRHMTEQFILEILYQAHLGNITNDTKITIFEGCTRMY